MFRIFTIGMDLLSAGIALVPVLLFLLRKDDRKPLALQVWLGLYFIAVFSATGVPSITGIHWDPEVSWIPLVQIAEGLLSYVKTALLNVALFMPLGGLLPLIWKEFRGSWRKTVAVGFCLSLFIEWLQLFNFRLTDVDDLLMNTVGTALGDWMTMKFICADPVGEGGGENAHDEEETRAYKRLLLIAAAAFLSMFFVQPFAANLFY